MAGASLHATAVAIDGEALLIRGPSGAGKSRLACALIARSTRARPILLIGDDRILLSERAGRLVARPHPRIAGFLERRGLGIVAMDWVAAAPVGGVVESIEAGRATPSSACGRRWPDEDGSNEGSYRQPNVEGRDGNAPTPLAGAFSRKREKGVPTFPSLTCELACADPDRILAWWATRAAAAASHPRT